jgi:ABC-type glycerol-3-phosphate transport system substrate-binding protein
LFPRKFASRREFLRLSAIGAAGAIVVACAPAAPAAPTEAPKAAAPAAAPTTAPAAAAPTSAPAAAAPTAAPAAAAKPAAGATTIRVHMVKKSDVSDWIQMGLDQNIDNWKDKGITATLETIPGWTPEYIPKILSMVSANQIGDALWYPPRHRSHIAWGTQYNVVRDLLPLAAAQKYDMKQFFPGALENSTFEGKTYWMTYISEPVVPIIAYNKTKVKAFGLPEPTDEMTFDDLAAWAKQGTKDNTFGYYRGDAGNTAFGGGPYFRQWGVEPVDKAGKKVTLMDTKDAFIASLKYRFDLMNTGKVSPSPSAGTINAAELFGGQKILAADIWPFRIQVYPATFKDFEIGFFLTPVVKKGDKRRTMLNEHCFGITQSTKQPEAAFTFLSWICGKEMNVQALIQGQKGPIARVDVWQDQRLYDKIPDYKKLRPLMESIESDYVVANFRGEEFDNAFAQAYDAMELGKSQPDAAAAEIQKLCQAVLDKQPA